MSTEKTPGAGPEETTPAPADDTVVIPLDEATTTPADNTAVLDVGDTAAAPPDDTVVLPVDETTPAPAGDTAVIPLDDTTAAPADDTAVTPLDDTLSAPAEDTVAIRRAPAVDQTAAATDDEGAAVGDITGLPAAGATALTLDETRALPTTDIGPAGHADPFTTPDDGTTPLAAADPATPYASPIGALYAPTNRPEPTAPPRTSAYAEPVGVPYPSSDRIEPVAAPVDPTPVDPPRRRLRVGTVVWGLIIAAIGVGLLAWAAGVAIDLQLAMIVLLAVAGTALLVGSIVSGARSARR